MRVALVTRIFPAISETFIIDHVTRLLDASIDVDVFASVAPERGPVHPDVRRYRLAERTTYWQVGREDPWRALRTMAPALRSLPRLGQILWRLMRMVELPPGFDREELARAAAAVCGRGPYDVVHAHFGRHGNLAVALRDLGALSGRVVTTFHGYDIRQGLESGPTLYAPLLGRGDLVLAISQLNRRHLLDFGFDPARVVDHPVGIRMRDFPFRWADGEASSIGKVRLLTVARLVPEKGIAFGLEAVARLRQERPGVQLEYHVVGDGPLATTLRSLAARLDLMDVVRFRGALTRDQVRAELAAAHLFVLPSIAEALPVALMEALATGLPTVATDVGAIGELVGEGGCGVLVAPGSAAAITGALGRLLDDSESWAAMGRAGRSRVAATHDADQLMPALIELYRRLCSESRWAHR